MPRHFQGKWPRQKDRAVSVPNIDFDRHREKKEKEKKGEKGGKFVNSKPWHFPEEMTWLWLVPI